MGSPQVRGRQMKRLAGEVLHVVHDSAGEMGRRQNWDFFVKNLWHDHTLLELADACFDAMDEGQKRQFRARVSMPKP